MTNALKYCVFLFLSPKSVQYITHDSFVPDMFYRNCFFLLVMGWTAYSLKDRHMDPYKALERT